MRVGIVCPYSFDEPGGVQAHIIDLAESLLVRGHHVQVIGPAGPDTPLPSYVTRGGDSVPIPYNGSVARLSFGPQVYARVKQFIREGNFDVLHIHEPNAPSYSLVALRVASGPIVATYHTSSTGSRLLSAALPWLRPQLEKIRGGIAVSEMARRWQVETLGGDPVLIPNGVRTAPYREAYQRHQEKRGMVSTSTAQKGAQPLEVVFLGRIDEPRKGLDILLEAIRLLEREVRVTVIGGGSPREVPGVEFLGRVSEETKATVLGRADIYVAPNTGGESFGIVLVEAMAAGCAVVASDIEAFRAVAQADSPDPAALLFENGSSTALAEQLRWLLDNPERRERLVQAGLRRARDFEWSSVVVDVEAVYATVADGSKVEVL